MNENYISPAGKAPAGVNSSQNFWESKMKTRYFELLEIAVGANQGVGRIMFPDIPQLRNTTLKALETWSGINVTTSPNGLPVINAASSAVAYFGLFINGRDAVVRMPLVNLNKMATNNAAYGGAAYEIQQFDDLQGVDWSKSYIYFASAPAATAFAIILGVHYV